MEGRSNVHWGPDQMTRCSLCHPMSIAYYSLYSGSLVCSSLSQYSRSAFHSNHLNLPADLVGLLWRLRKPTVMNIMEFFSGEWKSQGDFEPSFWKPIPMVWAWSSEGSQMRKRYSWEYVESSWIRTTVSLRGDWGPRGLGGFPKDMELHHGLGHSIPCIFWLKNKCQKISRILIGWGPEKDIPP